MLAPAPVPPDALLQLRRSRDQLDGILRALTDAVLVRDFTGALVYANDSAAKLLRLREPGRAVRIDDEDGHPLAEAPDLAAFRQRVPDRLVMLRDGDDARFCIWRAMPIADGDARVTAVVSVVRDVTSERKAQQDREQLITLLKSDRERLAGARARMEMLQRLAAELSAALTLEQVGDVVVERALDALGATHAALWTVRGERVRDRGVCCPELPIAQVAQSLQPAWQDKVAVVPLVAGGSAVGVLSFGFAEVIDAREREFVGLFAHHCALALERARLQENDARARREAEEASRAKDEFLAILGHELRNPLAPIVTALQLLRLRGAGNERERSVIERQVQHLVRLVDDLLDISRITRGNLELKKEPLELADVVARGIELASPLIEQRRQHLDTSVGRGLVVDADPARLAQVVANLLVNAAKYTPEGGHVVVSARKEGDFVVCSVKDDGIGIEAELLPRVFEAFVQGKQSADRSRGGMGLGLAIVRSLVRLHDGDVQAISEGVGRGSEFRVRLPLTGMPAHVQRVRAGEPLRLVRRRILIVDDNVDAADLLCEALDALGYETAAAHDGPEALALAEKFQADTAILDIGLPVMDGYELAARLRMLPSRPAQLIALTGYGQESDRDRAAAAGFDHHLVKPVDLDEVQRALKEKR